MADDIDIEEHDVLDNPQIKNIFPDLTKIKTEVLHEEDEFPYEDYADYNAVHVKTEPQNVEAVDYPQIGSKIILGTKPCPTTIVPKIEPKDNVEGDDRIEDLNAPDTALDVTEKENLNAYVLLEDWGPTLSNSPCFCKECSILFDTINTYDAHKTAAHSLLAVVPSLNKAVKSTAKSANDGLLLCNHCNKMFPDNASLIKHLYLVMGQEKEEKSASKTSNKDIKVFYYKCTICTCYFVKSVDLKQHMALNHRVTIVNTKISVFNKECAFCLFQCHDKENYNFHITDSHDNLASGILKAGKLINYQCTLCNVLFASRKSFYRHKMNDHKDIKHKHLGKKIVTDLKKLQSITQKIFSQNHPIVDKILPEPSKNDKYLKQKQLPISHLFKCANCNVYFLTAVSAKSHVVWCSNTKIKTGLLRCTKCPRYFREANMQLHEYQHTFNNNFKAITLNRNGKEIFFYECALCKDIIESSVFSRHNDVCDGTPSGHFCRYCKISIPKHEFSAHVTKHTKGFNVVIKCVLINSGHTHNKTVKPLKREIEEDVQKIPNKIQKVSDNCMASTSTISKALQDKLCFYYCSNCQCITERKKGRHIDAKCHAIQKKLCPDCGLIIGRESPKHALLHSTTKFTLHDVTLYDYDDKRIPIPMSKFHECDSCRVHFVAQRKLIQHSCSNISFKICKVCNIKIESNSYEVHYAFHEVDSRNREKERELPDLLMKYEALQAIWNILYQCGVCSTVTDSYDVAVEHSQAHYCQMESFGVILQNCDICKLAFKSDCYQKHKELHQGATLNRASFNLIQFNYLDLNSRKWFAIFNSLEPKIVKLILSNSLYKHTRSVRMKLLQEGTNGESMYLCAACDRMVHAHDVTSHALNVDKCSNVDYSRHCELCDYKFASEFMFLKHSKPKHIDMKAYRILAFNSEEDQTIINAMRNLHSNEETLKTHNEHVKEHVTATKKNSKGKYIYYRCIKCKMGLAKLGSMYRHTCLRTNKVVSKCPYCHLVFLTPLQKKHMLLHRKVYGLNANKLLIEDFKPKSGKNEAEIIQNNSQSPKKVDKITIKLFTKRSPATLFRCIDCDICFFNLKNIKYHFKNHDKKLKIETCDECRLRFKASALVKHKYKHHQLLKLQRKDFHINSKQSRPTEETNTEITEFEDTYVEETDDIDELKNAKNEDLNVTKTNKRALYKCYLCPVHSTTLQMFQKHLNIHTNNTENVYRPCKHCKLNFQENFINTHEHQHFTNDFYVIENAIAYCTHCKVYLQNFSAYNSHKFKHSSGFKFTPTVGIKCSTCSLNIASKNYLKHLEYFHTKNKIKLEDYYVIGAEKTKIVNNTVDETEDKIENDTVDRILYKCSECTLLLVDKANHNHKDKTPAIESKCELCNLSVISNQIDAHKELHHSKRNSSKFVIKTLILIYKCTKCNLCSHDYESMAFHQNNHNRRSIAKMMTQNCDICSCSFSNSQYRRHIEYHSKVEEKREEIHIIDCDIETIDEIKIDQTIDEAPSTSKDDRVPSPNTKKYKVKLYKCGDCNVCFLSQGVCYKHVLKHTALDAREFVECKICSLQFSLMIYHKHMKKHHIDDNYNLEDVLIEEYRPKEMCSPEIEIYYAGDRVQSHLVSTTSEVTQSNTVTSDVIDNIDVISEPGR